MLKAIQELGQVIKNKTPGFSVLLDELPRLNSKNKIIMENVILIQVNGYKYTGIKSEEYDENNAAKYLYKRGSPQGGDFTISSRLNYSKGYEVNKTLKRFKSCFKDISKAKIPQADIDIGKLQECFLENEEQIQTDIEKKISEWTNNAHHLISFTIDGKYLGDYRLFQSVIADKFYSDSARVGNKKAVGKNKTCGICGEQKPEVYGAARNFTFYTIDKWSFIASGFDEKQSWKNYPICKDCLYEVEVGKRTIEKKLKFRFCGFDYYIIPKIIEDSAKNLEEVFEWLSDFTEPSFQKEIKANLLENEDEIFDYLQEEDDFFNMYFLFYKIENSAFRILLNIEGVSPSLLRKLFETQSKVLEYPLFKKIDDDKLLLNKEKDIYFNPRFTFDKIRHFFPNSKMKGNFDKSFLEVIGKIFTQKAISWEYLLDRITKRLSTDFKNDYRIDIPVYEALIIFFYLSELEILDNKKGGNMEYINDVDEDKQFADFFSTHSKYFDNEAKAYAFLTGILAGKLLAYQYKMKSSKPFYKRLNSLKLNPDTIKRIHFEAVNKLEEYSANYYPKLETLMSKYAVKSDFTKISNNELSFAFTAGLGLCKEFLKGSDKQLEEEQDVKIND